MALLPVHVLVALLGTLASAGVHGEFWGSHIVRKGRVHVNRACYSVLGDMHGLQARQSQAAPTANAASTKA